MGDIERLIAAEQAKIDLFKEKIAVCQQRISVLQSIQGDTSDAVDAAAVAAITSKPKIILPTAAIRPVTSWPFPVKKPLPKRPLGDVAKTCLSLLSDGGKSFDQIMAGLEHEGVESTRHNARCTLVTMEKKFGFIRSPSKQYYEITRDGKAFIESQ